jgi:DNA adenine methylase
MQEAPQQVHPAGGSPSFLRWAGSKRQILPELELLWGEGFDRYVEPFAGSACLFFRVEPGNALLSDTNEWLVKTLNAVKMDPVQVHHYLTALETTEAGYYLVRSTQRLGQDAFERAAKFIFLNRLCFNGIYRTNSAGEFNVPFGGGKSGQMVSLDQLENASRILEAAEIECCDFETTLRNTQEGDFVYIDPPYSVRSRRVFREYDQALFGLKALCRLRLCLTEMRDRGVSFVLSYADSPEAKFLCEGLSTRSISVRRTIAGFSKHRRMETEILAVSPDLEAFGSNDK